jgi:hypothetical protein
MVYLDDTTSYSLRHGGWRSVASPYNNNVQQGQSSGLSRWSVISLQLGTYKKWFFPQAHWRDLKSAYTTSIACATDGRFCCGAQLENWFPND